MKKKMLAILGICMCMAMAGCNNYGKMTQEAILIQEDVKEAKEVSQEESIEESSEAQEVEKVSESEESEEKTDESKESVEDQVDESKESKEDQADESKESKEDQADESKESVEDQADESKESKENQADEGAESKEDQKDETVEPTKATSKDLSENLYDFQMEINGKVVSLPISVKELQEMGFAYENKDNRKLVSEHIALAETMKDGKFTMLVNFVNFDVNEQPFENCYVYRIKAENYYIKKCDAKIVLPKGITQGVSTKEDVEAAYGTPTKVSGKDTKPVYNYSLGNYRSVEFRFDGENGNVLTDVEMENCVVPDDFNISAADTSVPAVTLAYETPAGFSEDLMDYVVEYANDLYQMPAPVAAFLENGWKISDGNEGKFVVGDGGGRIEMMKDNQKISVLVKNYSDDATEVENCFVTTLKADIYNSNVDLKLSDKIYKGMSADDLEKALEGMEVEKSESASMQFIKVADSASRVDGYSFTIKDGKVIGIDISFQPKQKALLQKFGM